MIADTHRKRVLGRFERRISSAFRLGLLRSCRSGLHQPRYAAYPKSRQNPAQYDMVQR